jgi:hypothetical protein
MEPRRVVKTDKEFYGEVLQEEKNPPRAKYSKEERENEPDPKLLKKANVNVTRPITRLFKTGRPKKYTPTKVRNKINDYFCHCEKTDKIPSLKGMVLYLKMTQNTCYKYMRYPEFEGIFDQARLIIAEWVENDVYTSKGQTAGKLAYMQNLHNWSNKTEVETTQKELSAEEARINIEALAGPLLEMLKANPDILLQLTGANNVKEAEVVNK